MNWSTIPEHEKNVIFWLLLNKAGWAWQLHALLFCEVLLLLFEQGKY